MIKRSVVVLQFFVLIYFGSIHSTFAKPTLAIIGAGLSGLTLAHQLNTGDLKDQYDFQVYEAKGRAGGRVHTVKIGNSIDELGGKDLTDGGDAVNMTELIKDFGLETNEPQLLYVLKYFDEENQLAIDINELMIDLPEYSESVEKKILEIEERSKDLQEFLNQFFVEFPILKKVYETRLKSYEGSDLDQLSSHYASKSFKWLYQLTSERRKKIQAGQPVYFITKTIQGGNAQLIQKIVDSVKDRVHFNSPLKGLRRDQDGTYLLHFDSKKTIKADLVVLTVPASVLKNIDFEEGLIPRLDEMKSLQYSQISKVLVSVSSKEKLFGSGLSERGSHWLNQDEKVLTLYYGGSHGRSSFEALNQFVEKDLSHIDKIFPTIQTAYNGKIQAISKDIPDEQFVEADRCIGMSWANDPYTQGGYSSVSPEQASIFEKTIIVPGRNGDEKVIELFKPIHGNTLFFAGEHTALEWPSTMEGAVESGNLVYRLIP